MGGTELYIYRMISYATSNAVAPLCLGGTDVDLFISEMISYATNNTVTPIRIGGADNCTYIR